MRGRIKYWLEIFILVVIIAVASLGMSESKKTKYIETTTQN